MYHLYLKINLLLRPPTGGKKPIKKKYQGLVFSQSCTPAGPCTPLSLAHSPESATPHHYKVLAQEGRSRSLCWHGTAPSSSSRMRLDLDYNRPGQRWRIWETLFLYPCLKRFYVFLLDEISFTEYGVQFLRFYVLPNTGNFSTWWKAPFRHFVTQ